MSRRSFRWDQRLLIASAEASVRRLESKPLDAQNRALLGSLRSMLDYYKGSRK